MPTVLSTVTTVHSGGISWILRSQGSLNSLATRSVKKRRPLFKRRYLKFSFWVVPIQQYPCNYCLGAGLGCMPMSNYSPFPSPLHVWVFPCYVLPSAGRRNQDNASDFRLLRGWPETSSCDLFSVNLFYRTSRCHLCNKLYASTYLMSVS